MRLLRKHDYAEKNFNKKLFLISEISPISVISD